MEYKQTEEKYSRFFDYVCRYRLIDAFSVLKEMVKAGHNDYFLAQYEKHVETYKNILRYAFSGVEDPERNNIYNKLVADILELGDKAKEGIMTEYSDLPLYKMKKEFENEQHFSEIAASKGGKDVFFNSELSGLIEKFGANLAETAESDEEIDEKMDHLFRKVLLTSKFDEEEIGLFKEFYASGAFASHQKALMISAIGISLLRSFDTGKFILLFDLYDTGEDEIWQRSLVGLMLGLTYYDDRLHLYPGILNRLKILEDSPNAHRYIEAVIIQLIKSKETKKLTKKWEDEILPEMLKMAPKIREKLDLENILKDPFFEDKNPDWETFFEDSPDLMDKLQEFSKMQLEGSDIFLSAFSRLKNFPFFDKMSHWLLPFYKENGYVKNVLQQTDAGLDMSKFGEALEKSSFICNSDKYSFILNVQHFPAFQKENMVQLLNSELTSMEDISNEDQIIDQFSKSQQIFVQYIQDLYRFFKLHPLKNNFHDIFSDELAVYQTNFFKNVINNNKILRNIAEFYFHKNYFDEALDIYIKLTREDPENVEMLEKAGYCYQMKNDYKNALSFYQQAEIFDSNKKWVIKKIALCHRCLNNHSKALEYYKRAENLEPESMYVLTYLGHTYLELKKYSEALNYYFKIDYLDPENEKIKRPLAWCSAKLGKYEQAQKYYRKSLEKKKNQYDLIQLGHLYWCANHTDEAIQSYKEALSLDPKNKEAFIENFNEEIELLGKHRIDKKEMALMLDYVRLEKT